MGQTSEPGSILAVDDEPLALRVISTVLKARGYSVVDAMSGEEALGKLRDHESEIRLLVTDIVMPHLNGIELAAEVQRKAPEVKVLYVSGYSLTTLESQGFAVDRIKAFLQKPFTPAVLAARVQDLLKPHVQ